MWFLIQLAVHLHPDMTIGQHLHALVNAKIGEDFWMLSPPKCFFRSVATYSHVLHVGIYQHKGVFFRSF